MTLRLCILLLLAALCSVPAPARRVNTRISPQHSAVAAAQPLDTLPPSMLPLVTVAGYDKPLRSRHEAFFVTNGTPHTISRLDLLLRYLDSAGRELHSRTASVDVDLPAGATSLCSIPAWDIQGSFYYRLSKKPRSGQATPYDVVITILNAFQSCPGE